MFVQMFNFPILHDHSFPTQPVRGPNCEHGVNGTQKRVRPLIFIGDLPMGTIFTSWSSYRCQILGDSQNHHFLRKFFYTWEKTFLNYRKRSEIALSWFSWIRRYLIKKTSSKNIYFSWRKITFRKKSWSVFWNFHFFEKL